MSHRNQTRARWPWRHTLAAAMNASRRERGTVLLMVVGVLALLAIIGVVYATIGRADRSASVTGQRVQRINDQAEEIAAYIARVIGDATHATYVERTNRDPAAVPAARPIARRLRGYTYPWTDKYSLSVDPATYANLPPFSNGSAPLPTMPGTTTPVANVNWLDTFHATGTNEREWEYLAATATTVDPREYGDPYLAVLEPEWLRFQNPPHNGPQQLADLRDWRHISVLSPSGAFVNLGNLRASHGGGFSAGPGFGVGQMSYGLTLFNPNTGKSYAYNASQNLPGTTINANPAVPAHWSNNQVSAFRPAVDNEHQPYEYEYLLNQWADTDGDGFVDARWFELTDISQLYGTNSAAAKAVVPTRGRVRLFVAARCIDNSAKINVNVAGDSVQGPFPTADYTYGTVPLTRDDAVVPGLSPAEIGLNRLLCLSDINATLAQTGPAASIGYSGNPAPSNIAPDRTTADYSGQYTQGGRIYDKDASGPIGEAGYAALVDARRRSATAAMGAAGNLPLSFAANARERLNEYDVFGADPRSARPSADLGTLAHQRLSRSPFDLSDELELVTFFNLNDSDTFSRLEAAVGGRAIGSAWSYPTFSPLRDNRPRSPEAMGRDNLDGNMLFVGTGASAQQNVERRGTIASVYSDVRHLLTTISGSRPIKDGSVASDAAVEEGAITDVTYALKRIREYSEIDPIASPTAAQTTSYQRAIQLIFRLYANALAPYTDIADFPNLWVGTAAGPDPRYAEGLCYSGNPELAIRMAAHMTANLVDAFDRDRKLDIAAGYGRPAAADRNDPVALSVKLTAAPGPNQIIPGYNPQQRTTNAYLGAIPLTLPDGRLAPAVVDLRSTNGDTIRKGLMNIYGIEPQPFLTEFGSFLIFTDAPRGAGGDKDWVDQILPGNGSDLLAEPIHNNATINTNPVLTNEDFLGEVIAFQINNPFCQDVVLYDHLAPATGAGDVVGKFKYYIEYSGRYYAFVKQMIDDIAFDPGAVTSTITLKAGHTQTFYVINPGTLRQIGDRIRHVDTHLLTADRINSTDYTQLAQQWIERQLQSTGADAPIQTTQVFPTTFHEVRGAAVEEVGTATGQQFLMDLWGEKPHSGNISESLDDLTVSGGVHNGADRQVCHLCGTMRSKSTLLGAGSPGVPDETGSFNDLTNDLLADRLRDPTVTSGGKLWEIRQKVHDEGNDEVDGASSGNDQDAGHIGENTGYSIIVWAAVRRPTDTKQTTPGVPGGTLDASGKPIRGVLPPWCMEARSDNGFGYPTTGSQFGLNKVDWIDTPSGSIHTSASHYGGSSDERFKKLKDLLSPTSQAANKEIGRPCAKKTSNPVPKNKDTSAPFGSGRDYSQVAVEFHSVGEDTFGGPDYDNPAGPSVAIRRSRNPALFSRSGDFLLPLAIGPWSDPSRQGVSIMQGWVGTVGYVRDREASWMTLSEAIALSSGYYSPSDPRDPLFEFGIHQTMGGANPNHMSRVDRGHLRLDAYAPYLAPQGSTVAQPLGSGVPFALSIIDQFRAAAGVSSTPRLNPRPGDPNAVQPELQTRDFAYGGGENRLDQGTNWDLPQDWSSLTLRQGVVNLNTAVLNTMRPLPGVSPEFDTLTASSWYRTPGARYTETSYHPPVLWPDDTVSPKLHDFDIAATFKAYRDLSMEEYRVDPTIVGVPRTVDFRQNATNNARTLLTNPTAPLVPQREAHGFKSLGELVHVNIYSAGPSGNPVLDVNSAMRFAINEKEDLGLPALPTGDLGTLMRQATRLSFWPSAVSSRFYNRTDTGVIDTSGQVASGSAQIVPVGGPELPDGYQDKLAIVNALTNTASVRSDIFTVYFLIHGYTPENLNIEDSQPLVPSIARRYVMVVDRSNVVAQTDKPRILMLKEVPLP